MQRPSGGGGLSSFSIDSLMAATPPARSPHLLYNGYLPPSSSSLPPAVSDGGDRSPRERERDVAPSLSMTMAMTGPYSGLSASLYAQSQLLAATHGLGPHPGLTASSLHGFHYPGLLAASMPGLGLPGFHPSNFGLHSRTDPLSPKDLSSRVDYRDFGDGSSPFRSPTKSGTLDGGKGRGSPESNLGSEQDDLMDEDLHLSSHDSDIMGAYYI